MTSRLKRKLGELGIDTTSRQANENFCLIGTPLPPLEKSKDTGEFVPLWKQDVRDEKGRRRLHGAFTGGFSAGYFNTVGSKEGWAPATFVSSRTERAKKKAARPEDFMDEEDLQDIKDSRNLVDTTEEMDLSGGTKMEGVDDDPITSALQASLLPAPKDSAGARILMRMGWRLGQGIGPRVSLRQRKLQDMQAIKATRGSRGSTDILDIPDDDEEANKHTYAPRDTPLILVERKDNSHGIGYTPGMGLNESLGASANTSKGPQLASGFGLGALNDADEDDLDVYDGINATRNRHAYDHIDGEDGNTVTLGKKADKSKSNDNRSSSSAQTFRDGRPVLPGFALLNEPVVEDKWFPLPDIPQGWTPNPQRVWSADANVNKENVEQPKLPSQNGPLPHEKWRRSGITADQRGSMLGEAQSKATRSVFEYLSEKDRERLKNIAATGKAQPSVSASTPGASSSTTSTTITIPRTEPHVAQAALRGFQPFTSDPTKQARYTAYLLSQVQQDSSAPQMKPASGQPIDQFNKELEDYAKAALLFKPISGAMAGRFTSAAIIEHGPKVQEGLHTPSQEELAEKEQQEAQMAREAEEKISPKAHAAKMGMYGPLTREVVSWQPARLLCKRFGVKDPNPPPDVEATEPPKAGSSSSSATFAQSSNTQASGSAKDETVPAQQDRGPRKLENIGLGEDETQGQDTLTYQRPAMDIFKAIFASDSEDSDDEDEVKGKENEKGADEKETGAVVPEPTTALPNTNGEGSVASTTLPVTDDGPVDMSTFKPTFIPREGKSGKERDERSKEKKEKKKKEKKGVLVSFEMDESGPAIVPQKPPKDKDRPKKKKRKEKEKREDENEDEGMWVEKPAPEVVKELQVPPLSSSVPSLPPSDGNNTSQEHVPRGRKRAIDFM